MMTKLQDWFQTERTYQLWFWIGAALVLSVDALWIHPTIRHLPTVQSIEIVMLRHPFSPLEILQQVFLTGLIIFVWGERKSEPFKHYPLFSFALLALLVLLYIEELSWGQIFHRYPWPSPVAPLLGPHIDVHNVMLGWADTSDLIEALAGLFICVLFVPFGWLRKILRAFRVPPLPLTCSGFRMLVFSFLLSPFSMIREVNEQDIIYENGIFAVLIMGILAFAGKLRPTGPLLQEDQGRILWGLALLPWVKFFYLVRFGHYPLFPVWP